MNVWNFGPYSEDLSLFIAFSPCQNQSILWCSVHKVLNSALIVADWFANSDHNSLGAFELDFTW